MTQDGVAGEPLVVWVDAQLPPVLAHWLSAEPGVEAVHTFTLGLLGADDASIFAAARRARAVVVTKDIDFVDAVTRFGAPPQIVWVTTGNISNTGLQRLVETTWSHTVELLRAGERIVELGSSNRATS